MPHPKPAPEPLTRGDDPPIQARRSLILAACLLATFMAAVESTIVGTAMPTIVADLGGFSLFSWVFTIFLLTQAVCIPVYGRLADLYGRKPVFFAGTSLFLVGSVLCGCAWGMVPLIVFRALQGFGAGAIMPVTSTILGDIYAPVERGKVQGLASSVFGVSAVIGPALGGFLVEHVSWKAVFWVNVPIGLGAMAMIGLFLRERAQRRQHQIDVPGALLMLIGIGALMLVLVQAGSLPRPIWVAALCICVLALALLIVQELRAPEPMLPLELWRNNRIIVLGSLAYWSSGAMMMGIAAFLPTYVQGAMGRTPMVGGLVLGAMSVSWALASIVGARIMARTTYRLTAVLGGISLVLGCGVLLTLSVSDGPWWVAAASFVIGIGMGFSTTTFIVSIQASVPWRQRGAATSSLMFMRFLGQVMGAAGCGAILNASLHARDPQAVHAIDRLLDPASRASLGAPEVGRLASTLADSLHNAYLLAAVFAVVCLGVALLMPARLNPTRHSQQI